MNENPGSTNFSPGGAAVKRRFNLPGSAGVQSVSMLLSGSGSGSETDPTDSEEISGQETPTEEAGWIRRAQTGDVTAFEPLYRAHVGRVYALCLRMLSDRSAAEELTQDTFVRAWERIESFRWEASFGTWVYRIAVNQVLSAIRSQRRFTDKLLELAGRVVPPSPSDAAPVEIDLDLERAVRQLPERARLVFLLHDVEGYKHAEIAEMMGLSSGTTKTHLHHARRKLRGMLER